MWRIIGWVLVFLFPLYMVYLSGGPDKGPEADRKRRQIQTTEKSTETPTKKNRKKKKSKATEEKTEKPSIESEKKNKKADSRSSIEPVVKKQQEKPAAKKEQSKKEQSKKEQLKKDQSKKEKRKKEQVKKAETVIKKEEHMRKQEEPVAKKEEPVANKGSVAENVVPTKEIDEHMDPTAKYARVLRIRPEEIEDEWESVPYEEGWSQVKTRRPAQSGSSLNIDVNAEINNTTTVLNSHLDKKQRENLARTQKKKEAKLAADKLQEERLRKHKKELEKAKIQEFYSSGKGKNTPWGKNGQRSKTPQSVASINEFGQLIWD